MGQIKEFETNLDVQNPVESNTKATDGRVRHQTISKTAVANAETPVIYFQLNQILCHLRERLIGKRLKYKATLYKAKTNTPF